MDEPKLTDSSKSTGKAIAGSVAGSLFTAGAVLSRAVSSVSNAVLPYEKENFKFNSEFKFSGFIHDQTKGDASLIKMGYHSGAYNGCGWVATYNASIIAGIELQPAFIIEYLEKRGGVFLNGLFGANPVAIKRLFAKSGARAQIYNFPHDIDGLVRGSSACVLMYAHKRGMHFVALRYKDGRYLLFNECPGNTCHLELNSVYGWLKEPLRKYSAVSLITIDRM